ncbi:MAG TPA: hypothetical protein VNA69_06075 [Thermoanaerobaculia bacterium]|nr:hypothetical protein [Thermoanaerobaculia bacterium]
MTAALYEPLIERDLKAIPAAARAFAQSHSLDELFLAVARFAVLAYAPSLHSKRAVMACRAAHELHAGFDVIVECARYAAESRQPWSEPPMLDPPDPSDEPLDLTDRHRAERWLSAHLDDENLAPTLAAVAGDDALLMLDTAIALIPILGEKGKYALLRMPIWELTSGPQVKSPDESLDTLINRVVTSRGAVDEVQRVFVYAARQSPLPATRGEGQGEGPPSYRLARDYAQTLIAHAIAKRLALPETFLAAVHDNLEHGESFAEWSFA